jgi:hypothetical protein
MNAKTGLSADAAQILSALLHEMKALRKTSLPVDQQIWDIDDIALHIGLTPDYTQRNVITQATFPPVRPIPTNKSGDRYSPRWRASEVIAWCLAIDKSNVDPIKHAITFRYQRSSGVK